MKKTLITLLLLGLGFAKAQTISIAATGSAEPTIKVTQPVNGFFSFPNAETYTLNADSTIKLPNKVTIAGNISITYNGKSTPVFLEPGQNMQITITANGKSQSVDVKGPNAEGIMLAGQINLPYYASAARAYFKKDSSMAAINVLIARDMSKVMHPFDSLLMAKKISWAFYSSMKRDIRCYYASVQASVIINGYNLHTLTKDMETAWPEVYKSLPPDAFAAGSPYFYYYAKDYVIWYKTSYLGSKDGSYQKQPYDAEDRYEETYKAIDANFTGRVKEYMQAMYLFDELLQQDYQRQLVDLYHRFTATYPASDYTRFLTPHVEQIKTYLAKASESFKPDEHLLAGDTIKSFDDLLAGFKGQTVFIDMWATWCGPCKAEFDFAPGLEKYLAAKNVQMLYVSMDNEKADKQWQAMIKYYGLAGNHVRASDSLRNDLMKRFWDGKGYSIPRYVIIKDGVVVEKDALRPSDKQKLYDQIGKYL